MLGDRTAPEMDLWTSHSAKLGCAAGALFCAVLEGSHFRRRSRTVLVSASGTSATLKAASGSRVARRRALDMAVSPGSAKIGGSAGGVAV